MCEYNFFHYLPYTRAAEVASLSFVINVFSSRLKRISAKSAKVTKHKSRITYIHGKRIQTNDFKKSSTGLFSWINW